MTDAGFVAAAYGLTALVLAAASARILWRGRMLARRLGDEELPWQ